MPSLRFRVSATTSDALANRKFSVVPAGGAIINVWCSGVTGTDSFGISIGDRDIMVDGSLINIESSADVIDAGRDQVVYNEVIGGGQVFLPVTVSVEAQFLIHLRYL